jgi:hypothetical protein
VVGATYMPAKWSRPERRGSVAYPRGSLEPFGEGVRLRNPWVRARRSVPERDLEVGLELDGRGIPHEAVGPGSPLDRSWDNDSETRSRERSFEVASRGGYARTVVGRLAYFDEEAQTYMVLTRSGALVRVPLRDITSSRGVPRTGPIVADALSRMSRLRSATTVSPP